MNGITVSLKSKLNAKKAVITIEISQNASIFSFRDVPR